MKFILNIIVVGIVLTTLVFLYQNYSNDIMSGFSSSDTLFTVYVDTVTMTVTVADSHDERVQGLSGVKDLPDLGGKLLIFDKEQQHGIWMKDMQFSIDVMWFNNDLELIYIEEQISPNSYPNVFAPPEDARFVLEANANLVKALNIQLGDRLILPSSILPTDVKKRLQQ